IRRRSRLAAWVAMPHYPIVGRDIPRRLQAGSDTKLGENHKGMPKPTKTNRKLPPIHPGEILREEFLMEIGMGVRSLRSDLSVPAQRVSEIVHQNCGITGEMARRLERYFGTSPQFWMNIQSCYGLETARDIFEAEVNARVAANWSRRVTGLPIIS